MLSYSDMNMVLVSLDSYSETYIYDNTATFTLDSTGTLYQRKRYKWTPDASDARCAPYIITFRGVSTTNIKILKDITLMIFVRTPALAYCDNLLNQLRLDTPIDKIADDKEGLSVEIAPNPFSSQTIISVQTDKINEELNFSLFSVNGSLVLNSQIYDNQLVLNKNELAAGLYFYKIQNKSGRLATGKIVVE